MCFCKHTGLRVREGTFVLLAALLFAAPMDAQHITGENVAEEPPDTLKAYSIGEVVVTANRHRFSVESSMPAQMLSGRELERLNSLSVADAIRYFSGVQLKDYGGVGGIKTINVRSLGSAHTAVFYDGMSIGNAQNGQVDLGKYSLDNIEAIELYNGQKSSIWENIHWTTSKPSNCITDKNRPSSNLRADFLLPIRCSCAPKSQDSTMTKISI